MGAHGETKAVKNPGSFATPATVKTVLLVLAVLGFATFGAGLVLEKKRAWFSFLQGHFYFMTLALGGLFFAAIQWLTGAMWSTPVRRVAESFTSYLPFALVSCVILFFGLHDIYFWTDPSHVKGDIVLEHKAGYLNVTFFVIRQLIALGIWLLFAWKMIGRSLRQDETKEVQLTLTNKSWAPLFLILFGISFTMVSFDQLMSLDPHWFSTMFGVYNFAGMLYTTFALTAVLSIYLKRKGALEGIVNENHLHDLGKFMFGFTVFYAYIGFSQFMLIWYANLPEETGYFLRRTAGPWFWVTLFLFVGKFLVPFFWLLPRDAKRSEKTLTRVGLWMLFAHWIDIIWMVNPEFSVKAPTIGWVEVGTQLGFLGLFGLVVTRFLSKNNVVAIGDPRLAEAVHHHHQ
jgi:hypothetical protein